MLGFFISLCKQCHLQHEKEQCSLTTQTHQKKNMKKKIAQGFAIALSLLLICSACKNEPAKKETTVPVKQTTDTIAIDTSPDTIPAFQDTLFLNQGDIPEGWQKQELGKGYYIAFPGNPGKSNQKKKKQQQYYYRKPKYAYFASVTDLSDEKAFQENRKTPTVFYDAVMKDLLSDFSDPDNAEEIPEIIKKEEFVFLNIYEAMRAELEATDFYLWVELVIIGKNMYTIAFVNYEEKSDAALAQLKDRFFYSFGKELHIE